MLLMAMGAALSQPVEIQPGVRIDREARTVEFDGVVAIDCHDPETPIVYLELVVCTPDTREHESLVVTTVQPSAIHAGLLAVGAEQGSPGRVEWDGATPRRIPASGEPLRVELVTEAGARVEAAERWMVREDGELGDTWRWVFAGSRWVEWRGQAFYDADGAGTVIGLATFGSEVVSPVRVISPESSVDAPVWIANAKLVPDRGEPVTVRLTVLGADEDD
ncbi:MAG: YdjY domain-containing protein [Planctomycetota bacterium]